MQIARFAYFLGRRPTFLNFFVSAHGLCSGPSALARLLNPNERAVGPSGVFRLRGGAAPRQKAATRERSKESKMKLVTAVIKPFKLDEVRQALTSLGVEGLTATEVKGYGRQMGHTEIYRGAEYEVTFLPKIKIEVAVDDGMADKVMEAILSASKTGQIGDGKIFVTPIEQSIRIRTGETGSDAL
jgi:nitrogen regulatory protein P-II 2